LCSNIYVSVPPSQVQRIRRIALAGQGGRAGQGGDGGAGGEPGIGGQDSLMGPLMEPLIGQPERSQNGPPIRRRAATGQPGAAGNPGRSGVSGRPRPAPWIFLNEEAEELKESSAHTGSPQEERECQVV
jgi:hypothetical protein